MITTYKRVREKWLHFDIIIIIGQFDNPIASFHEKTFDYFKHLATLIANACSYATFDEHIHNFWLMIAVQHNDDSSDFSVIRKMEIEENSKQSNR